ncbi:MAG: bifunctional riboflavin kinase/FAD synthetase [Planctomycetes bacterium]|nr:bifunctional riboflavin kinase/FAD synthetase [Planctomycetota bacterium]
MDTVFGIGDLPGRSAWPVVTLGMFDGVHLGHQEVIQTVLRFARSKGGRSIIVTFDRHPGSFVSKSSQSCITSLEHRLVLFERLGVDTTVVLEFNQKLAETSAEDFITDIMQGWLGSKVVVLGFNCKFGKGRRGDASMVSTLTGKGGVEVVSCERVKLGGEVVSSTAIRKSIVQGDLQKAEKMLGRRVSVLGTVIRGDGRGRGLGYPTANLNLHHEIKPPEGVYAARVLLGAREYSALTNIGVRPTFKSPSQNIKPSVEVHIIGFDGSIYGEDLEVQFLYKLREEMKFRDVEDLKLQLKQDVAAYVSVDASSITSEFQKSQKYQHK